MVIQIETAQNGFVVRDTQEEGTTPIIVNDFNQLVGVMVQAFNVQVEGAEGAEGETDTEGVTDTGTPLPSADAAVKAEKGKRTAASA